MVPENKLINKKNDNPDTKYLLVQPVVEAFSKSLFFSIFKQVKAKINVSYIETNYFISFPFFV